MPEHLYQLLALAARALFIALAALVALRALICLLSQHRARKKLLKQLPDAGMVGEMRDMETDKSYPLPREGVLGSGRGCDIRLKGLRRRHVAFSYVPGKGILLSPCHRRTAAQLDGSDLRRPAYALHGAMLSVGVHTLRIRLFAGLDVPEASVCQEHWQPVPEEEYYTPGDAQTAGFYPQGVLPDSGEIPLFDLAPSDQPLPPAPPRTVQAPVSPETPPAFYRDSPVFLPGDDKQPEEEETEPCFDGFPPAYPAENPAAAQQRHRRSDRRREK